MAKQRVTKGVAAHWTRVAAIGCIVTGRQPVTLHHVHGGSCKERGIHKGLGMKSNHWLVIPLHESLHLWPPHGIDSGALSVDEWETRFGTQVAHLERVSRIVGYDVFEKAGLK